MIQKPKCIKKYKKTSAQLFSTFLAATFCSVTSLTFAADFVQGNVPESLSFQHSPTSPDEGVFRVILNEDGVWQTLQNQSTFYHARYRVTWKKTGSTLPNLYFSTVPLEGNQWFSTNTVLQEDERNALHTEVPITKYISVHSSSVFTTDGIIHGAPFLCRQKRTELLDSGKSLYEIFSKDWVIDKNLRVKAHLNGIIHNFASYVDTHAFFPVKLICEGNEEIAENFKVSTTLQANPPEVSQATVAVAEEAALNGATCQVNLSSVIQTTHPEVNVQYRYEHSTNNSGNITATTEWKTIHTDQTNTAMFVDSYDIPAKDGPETGFIRVVTTSPTDRESNWMPYSMDCVREMGFKVINHPEKTISFAEAETRIIRGQICPVKGILVAKISATGTSFGGYAKLGVNKPVVGFEYKEVGPFQISETGRKIFGMPYEFDWDQGIGGLTASNDDLKSQKIRWFMQLRSESEFFQTAGNGGQDIKELHISCRKPVVNMAVATTDLGLTQTQNLDGKDLSLKLAPTNLAPAKRLSAPVKRSSASAKATILSTTQLPDLKIKKAVQTGKKRMKVLVANIGKANSPTTTLEMSGGENNSAIKPVESLAPGSSKWVVIKLPKKAKKAKFVIDPLSRIKEADEKNNKFKKAFK